jgi:membrane protein DedA with SNARE-associated domain
MGSFLTQTLTHAGYLALIILAFVEACSIPISSEITFGFAGVLAYEGHLSLPLVIIIGTLAEVAGSLLSYAVGRKGGRPLVDRIGKYLLVTQREIDRVEQFFDGRGAWFVAVGRALPLLRAFIGLVSGLAEVPALQFGLFSLLGTAVYATVLSVSGYALGHAWQTVSHDVSYAGYVLAALVVVGFVAYILFRLWQVRRERATLAAQPSGRDQVPAAESAESPAFDAAQPPAGTGPATRAARPASHRRDASGR